MQKIKKELSLVSVLILTYNRTDLLKTCLDSALESNYPHLEFIISDNESKEDIKGFVKKNYSDKRIKVVRLRKNKGLTGGFNFGFKFCRGKYVMLMCNDTKIDKQGISKMVEMADADSEIGMVAPLVTQMRNPNYIHSAGSFLTNTGILYHYGVYQKKSLSKYKKPYYIFSSTGAGFLVRRTAILKTGLYSEDFFMAYDESDLCHRVWLGGYTIVFCPKAELQHYWSATMDSSNQNKLWFWNQRNILSSFLYNFSVPQLILFMFNVNITLIFWFLVRIAKGRFMLALTLPKAYFWHLSHVKQTLRRRKEVQMKVREVTDTQIFKKALVSPDWKYYLIHFNKKYNEIDLPKRVLYKLLDNR